jgi:signal transduction histidine kinase
MALTDLSLFLLLGPLVGVLFYLRRENHSERFLLWITGWLLMALHVGVLCLTRGRFPHSRLLTGYHLATHGVSTLLFLLSFSSLVNSRRRLWQVLALLGIPAAGYACFFSFDLKPPLFYLIPAIFIYAAAIFSHWQMKAVRRLSAPMIAAGLLCGSLTMQRICVGDVRGGFNTILAAMSFVTALMVVRCYQRLTPGPALTAMGFLLWAAGWELQSFVPGSSPLTDATATLWNVPKILTAMGMILLELENRSLAAREAEQREHLAGAQIRRFAELTRNLLGGAELRAIAVRITEAITASGDYHRAAILLSTPSGKLSIAGLAGITPGDAEALAQQIEKLDVPELEKAILAAPVTSSIAAILHGAEHPHLSADAGETLLIPLRQHLDELAGCILLESDGRTPRSNGLAAIELLASDMAVALEKDAMQRQVLIHEKQAAIGQLVSGVAHELNNPLTVLIGYCDLLGAEPSAAAHHKEISTMRSEAMRMKSIIDNLLLFSRQARTQTRFANLRHAVGEAIALRGQELKRSGIDLNVVIDENLPAVIIDEAQLKTILVQLIDNACDAVHKMPVRIVTITAHRRNTHVRLSVADSGPGLSDLDRVFDPFYSTKALGRGTGLGLSICYGIVKQHGGEISARNLEPQGAVIAVDLRIRATPAAAADAEL